LNSKSSLLNLLGKLCELPRTGSSHLCLRSIQITNPRVRPSEERRGKLPSSRVQASMKEQRFMITPPEFESLFDAFVEDAPTDSWLPWSPPTLQFDQTSLGNMQTAGVGVGVSKETDINIRPIDGHLVNARSDVAPTKRPRTSPPPSLAQNPLTTRFGLRPTGEISLHLRYIPTHSRHDTVSNPVLSSGRRLVLFQSSLILRSDSAADHECRSR